MSWTDFIAQLDRIRWIVENPEAPQWRRTSNVKAMEGYQSRRWHSLSRKGCSNCKQGKVKCDRAKPTCGSCQDRGLGCDFSSSAPQSPQSPHATSYALAEPEFVPLTAREQIIRSWEAENFTCQSPTDPDLESCDKIELLDHFMDVVVPCTGTPKFQELLRQDGLRIALGAYYLLHAILALSASHLSYLYPERNKYSVATVHHYGLSMTSYLARVRTGLTPQDTDSIVACCQIHTMLAFQTIQVADIGSGEVYEAATPGQTAQSAEVMWQTGPLSPGLEPSPWVAVGMESMAYETPSCHHDFPEDDESRSAKTSRSLHELCEVDPVSDDGPLMSPYQEPLARLCHLFHTEPTSDSIGQYMSFIGFLPLSFMQLLQQNDPRALLLLCYWCARVSMIDQWWIVRSAQAECLRLCRYLDMLPGQEMHDLLAFPASRCGYEVREMIPDLSYD